MIERRLHNVESLTLVRPFAPVLTLTPIEKAVFAIDDACAKILARQKAQEDLGQKSQPLWHDSANGRLVQAARRIVAFPKEAGLFVWRGLQGVGAVALREQVNLFLGQTADGLREKRASYEEAYRKYEERLCAYETQLRQEAARARGTRPELQEALHGKRLAALQCRHQASHR